MTALSPLCTAALAYAARGWPVFPSGRATSSRSSRRQPAATVYTTPQLMFHGWNVGQPSTPDANIGLACGQHFWVLDADYGGHESADFDGVDALEALRLRFGPLPRTVGARTGSGGWHYGSRATPGQQTRPRILSGVDTRNARGYIVAPPSVHPNGKRYEWIGGPGKARRSQAPAWLIALVEPLDEGAPRRPSPGGAGQQPHATARRRSQGVRADRVGRPRQPVRHARPRSLRDRAARWPAASSRATSPRPSSSPPGVGCGASPAKPAWTPRGIAWRVGRASRRRAGSPAPPEAGR